MILFRLPFWVAHYSCMYFTPLSFYYDCFCFTITFTFSIGIPKSPKQKIVSLLMPMTNCQVRLKSSRRNWANPNMSARAWDRSSVPFKSPNVRTCGTHKLSYAHLLGCAWFSEWIGICCCTTCSFFFSNSSTHLYLACRWTADFPAWGALPRRR